MDDFKNLQEGFVAWKHWVPFAALTVRSTTPNRSLATRLLEQTLVAVIAGGGAAYGVNNAVQARHDEQIKHTGELLALQVSSIQAQMTATEERLTVQIVELRARQLK